MGAIKKKPVPHHKGVLAISGAKFFKFIYMKTSLKRPLVFFDLETTGLSLSKDRVIQISFTKIFPGDEEPLTKTRLINPSMSISKGASDVHGITNEMLEDEYTFSQIAESFHNYIKDCDLAGHFITGFDIPLLREEFLRCGIDWPSKDVKVIDTYVLISRMFPRKLESLYKAFTGNDAENAHDAEFDNLMVMEILTKILEGNGKVSIESMLSFQDNTVDELDEICKPDRKQVDYSNKIVMNNDDEFVYNFGRHKGEKVTNYPGFAKWMMVNDFTEDTKQAILRIFGAISADEIK